MKKAFLSLLGVGFTPLGPGTVASVVSAGLLLGLHRLLPGSLVSQLIYWLTIFLIIYFLSWLFIKQGIKDNYDQSWIVIDEFLGMMLAYVPFLFIDYSYWYLILLLILFRFFDILKPLGIKKIDQRNTPHSVLLDDLLAGFYTLVIFLLVTRYLG